MNPIKILVIVLATIVLILLCIRLGQEMAKDPSSAETVYHVTNKTTYGTKEVRAITVSDENTTADEQSLMNELVTADEPAPEVRTKISDPVPEMIVDNNRTTDDSYAQVESVNDHFAVGSSISRSSVPLATKGKRPQGHNDPTNKAITPALELNRYGLIG